MAVNKWMSKLTSDFAKIAADMPKPSDSVISLPSPSFNWAVGNGGLTEGKAICFFGPESGGKSLLSQLSMIQLQKKHPESIQILIDAEFAFNPLWFQKLGGDLNRLIVKQTNDPLEIFDWLEKDVQDLLQQGAPINGLMIDSVKSIRYPNDIKAKSTDITMGGSGAKYLGPALKGLLPLIRRYNITTFLVQQVYEEMDQYKKMNNPWIIPDGRSLKHFCDYMLQVERVDTKDGRLEVGKTITGSAQQIGHKVRVKGKKNRVGAPYRVAEFTLQYDSGIVNTEVEVYELAKSLGVIYHPANAEGKVNNQMWAFKNYAHIRGEANMQQWITADKALLHEVYEACLEADEAACQTRNTQVSTTDVDLDVEL